MLFINRTKSKTTLIETALTGESLYFEVACSKKGLISNNGYSRFENKAGEIFGLGYLGYF